MRLRQTKQREASRWDSAMNASLQRNVPQAVTWCRSPGTWDLHCGKKEVSRTKKNFLSQILILDLFYSFFFASAPWSMTQVTLGTRVSCNAVLTTFLCRGQPVTPQNVIIVILTQNVTNFAAKCNINAKCNKIGTKCNKGVNAKCNNFSMQNVITLLT